ncbi:hypothetical protein SAMN05660479_02849 [Microbulbifer thermotolerans]|uniref:hypothetical protein n=1 Tax=Microbulbifer thermotolerans TaxID=252514 RepID=UPI0008EAFA72|nr:hypothetical protein [Microbulbifer thermotolerans]SFC97229.1 hypothetical protein SAMN05660479_02849 [Microbulbifer thermotolerans]
MSMWSWGFSVISLFIAENVMAVEDLFEKNAELGVGVDCQNLEVIYKLKNKGRGYLGFSRSELNLELHMPHIFLIVEEGKRASEALRYKGKVSVEVKSQERLKSSYLLYPEESVYIRNSLSKYYDVQVGKNYSIETSISFSLPAENAIVGTMLRFSLDCGSPGVSLKWVEYELFDGWYMDKERRVD